MKTLHDWATQYPAKPALIEGGAARVVTYGELVRRAERAAAWLVDTGLNAGDGITLLLENRPELIELACAARQAGLYYTAVSTHLAPEEIRYIVQDSGAKVLVVSAATLPLLEALDKSGLPGVSCFVVGEATSGAQSYEAALLQQEEAPVPLERPVGRDLLYSSGTTGRPKGVRRPMTSYAERNKPDLEVEAWRRNFAFDEHAVYLSTAPLYHAAPLRYVLRTLDSGGTCVVMAKFEPQAALSLIAQYRVTHSQWVPTMFVRLLKLPEDVRKRYDLSSLRVAVHAAAPCPIHVKRAMLDWWGDIVHEYYAGSEGAGATSIGPLEWREHPGSVGRAMSGKIHIVDDEDRELPPNEIGRIYFSGVATFAYLNDPEKTRGAYNDRGWATYGDVGYVDEDGYLYLSDRRTDLILSGGVNVYPQEIENLLGQHPAVEDVAVIGVPNEEFGEVPKAIVQLRDPALASSDLARELVQFCGERMARLKLPRSVVFEPSLPRLDNGKLLRRVLKDRYREAPDAGYVVRPGSAIA
jgi:acyl-CoA synthetase (AMP-forming)/AMP-acid ligase II